MNFPLPKALPSIDPVGWVNELARGGEVPLALQEIRAPWLEGPWHEVLLAPAARFPAADNLRLWATAKRLRLGHRLDARVIAASLWRMAEGVIPGRASVNITAESLTPGFAAALEDQVRFAHVDPQRVCLELSESEPLPATRELIDELQRLRDAGFLLALDDFGVGANHLGLLAHVRMDVLKVDASIVQAAAREEGEPRHAGAVLEGILGMSRAVRLATVLEGIETNAKDLALADSLPGVGLQGWGISPLQPIA